ncbi:hypothetical protein PVAND_017073 [Polypedilum vanderplanki]|uniref:Glutathione S-transferase n=1 Tax=Polypedilum vanderplanki TaxID=319348 RepID=A0A9J6BI25_POLVA|nr:hypothetical protein PVAND_017073 [Polypedilum vanderplanki]
MSENINKLDILRAFGKMFAFQANASKILSLISKHIKRTTNHSVVNRMSASEPKMTTKSLHLTKGSSQPTFPDNENLRLYSMKYCPYAHRAHLVLDAKNIPYHTVFINLTEKPEWYQKVSALTKVPALELPEVKGDSLIESLIICDYIDEKYPQNQLNSKDSLEKARDRILVQRFETLTPVFGRFIYWKNEEEKNKIIEKLYAGLTIFETELKERNSKFFGGEKPKMLDYMIWPWFERFELLNFLLEQKFELNHFSKLSTWFDGMMKDEAVKKNFINIDDHYRFVKTRNYDNVAGCIEK